MRVNVRDAMTALFNGKEYTNASIQTRQKGVFWETVGNAGFYLPTVYSYGDHYPLVILTPEGNEAYVNTRKVSATTSTQQSGAAAYLATIAGFRKTGQTVDHRHETYDVWEKIGDDPRYTGPAYNADSRTYGPRRGGN